MSTQNLTILIIIALLTAGAFIYVSRPVDDTPPDWDRTTYDETLAIGEMAGFVFADELAPATGTFRNMKGRTASFADFEGKVLLVHFWATWCAPCRHEMPAFDALEAEYGGPYFEIVAISTDRKGLDHADQFLKDELGIINFSTWHEGDNRTAVKNGVTAMPTTFLIGADGMVLGRLAGAAEWASDDAKRLIEWAIDRD